MNIKSAFQDNTLLDSYVCTFKTMRQQYEGRSVLCLVHLYAALYTEQQTSTQITKRSDNLD